MEWVIGKEILWVQQKKFVWEEEVGINVQGGKRKEYIPKQNSFVPTSSASNMEYVPATVLKKY